MMKFGALEDMLKEFSDGTYDLTDNGKCTGCGSCCTNFLPMTEKEVSIIRRYIKRNNVKEQKHFIPSAAPTVDMTCPFLDDSKSCDKCLIYEVRPKVCRDFICRPSDRPTVDRNFTKKCMVVDVRGEFY